MGIADRFQHVEEHGLDDKVVVIIPAKLGAITVSAVALLPFLMSPLSGLHPFGD